MFSPLNALRHGTLIDSKRLVGYPIVFLFVYAFFVVAWIFELPVLPEHKGLEFAHDFIGVYAAGSLAHEGKAAALYDWDLIQAREHEIELSGDGPTYWDGFVPWLYPPLFLGVAWLLAWLPYYYALTVYYFVSYAAYGASLYQLVKRKKALWAIAAFPSVTNNLLAGQNGFITTALLATGFVFLEKRPVVAGIFFGMLSYKPQFFVLVPLALAAGRYGRALWATLASAGVCAGLSALAFGLEPWFAFVRGLGDVRAHILENDTHNWLCAMHTIFSGVRLYGGSLPLAYALQAFVTLAVILALVLLWRKRPAPFCVRGASLSVALLLATPYSFGYDQVLLSIPIALFARKGLDDGFLPYEKTFLCLVWILPTVFQFMGERVAIPLTPLVLVAVLGHCWRRLAPKGISHSSPS